MSTRRRALWRPVLVQLQRSVCSRRNADWSVTRGAVRLHSRSSLWARCLTVDNETRRNELITRNEQSATISYISSCCHRTLGCRCCATSSPDEQNAPGGLRDVNVLGNYTLKSHSHNVYVQSVCKKTEPTIFKHSVIKPQLSSLIFGTAS